MSLSNKQGSCVILKPTPSTPSPCLVRTREGFMDPLQKQRSQREVEVLHFYNINCLNPNINIFILFLIEGIHFKSQVSFTVVKQVWQLKYRNRLVFCLFIFVLCFSLQLLNI